MKDLQRCYRGTVLKAARYGRFLEIGEKADSFMSLELFEHLQDWRRVCNSYFEHIDELPHHYHMHMMHAAEILGYKHPNLLVAGPWQHFYYACCEDAHLPPESHEDMDKRLSDWGREFWFEGVPF